jgi:hypothetical protein
MQTKSCYIFFWKERGTKSVWLGSEVTVLYFAHLYQNYKESILQQKYNQFATITI